jgi:hypothetical protein
MPSGFVQLTTVNRYASATVKVSPVRYFLPASWVSSQSNFFLRFASA